MVVGLSVGAFTLVHVFITLVAIASGFVVVFGLIGSHRLLKTTAIFWLMTVLTTVTGFMFFLSPAQAKVLTPATLTGIVATILFIPGLTALYAKHLDGNWRWIYVVSAVISLYLNVFVLIVQSFGKLKIINPAASFDPPFGPPFPPPTDFHFAVVQGVTLVIFVMLGIIATIKFKRAPGQV